VVRREIARSPRRTSSSGRRSAETRSGKIMRRILRKIAANEHDQLGDITTWLIPRRGQLVEYRMNR